jgi:hypothetical protein
VPLQIFQRPHHSSTVQPPKLIPPARGSGLGAGRPGGAFWFICSASKPEIFGFSIISHFQKKLARNYWDEMGPGNARGMHGPMLARIGAALGRRIRDGRRHGLGGAGANQHDGRARRQSPLRLSIDRALGVIEMTAPDRVALVDRGLDRLGVPKKARHYFALHTILGVKHSAAWNHEILRSLVAAEPRAARPIGEGALLRLRCGGRCFRRYCREFRLSDAQSPHM